MIIVTLSRHRTIPRFNKIFLEFKRKLSDYLIIAHGTLILKRLFINMISLSYMI